MLSLCTPSSWPAAPSRYLPRYTAPRSAILALGSETQLAIIALLGCADLVRLEQTCTRFYELLNTSEKAVDIWRQRLRSHCYDHNLFWPSYKDLVSAADFEGAATASLRFASAYERSFGSGILPSTSFRLELPEQVDEPPMYLVPGGRLAVIVDPGRGLCVVDLHAQRRENPIILKYATDQTPSVPDGCVWVAEEGTKVYVLQQYTCPKVYKAHAQDPRKMSVTTYTIIELRLEADKHLCFSKKAKLTVMHLARQLRAYPVLDGSVALIDNALRIAFIWDPIRGAYAAFTLARPDSEHENDDIQVFSQEFSHGYYLFCASKKGIHAARISGFRGLMSDSVVLSNLYSNAAPTPFTDHGISLTSSKHHIVEARAIKSPYCAECPLVYEVILEEPQSGMLQVYRYEVTVAGFGRDVKVDLSLIETSKCKPRPALRSLTAHQQVLCDGCVSTMWVNGSTTDFYGPSSAHISFSLPVDMVFENPSSDSSTNGQSYSCLSTEFGLAQFWGKNVDCVFEFGFCPVSATAALLASHGPYIQVYKFA